MDDPRVLVQRARDALGSAEKAFSKVQTIGKSGNERCAALTERIGEFTASYESAREEVNAALALVEAQPEDGGGAGADAAAAAVNEALELETGGGEHLRLARDANRDFQRQRKAVRARTLSCSGRSAHSPSPLFSCCSGLFFFLCNTSGARLGRRCVGPARLHRKGKQPGNEEDKVPLFPVVEGR